MDGMRAEGYQALRDGAAWIDVSSRGRILAQGEDRSRLLHAMTTNHIEELEPGGGCYAFFLNAQGRILGDLNVLCFPGHLLLDTEPETAEKLYAHLDKHIIADDVTLENVTGRTAAVGLEGPASPGILAALDAPAPEAPCAHASWGTRTVARVSFTGATGFSILFPLEEKERMIRELESAGAVHASAEAARIVRIEHGKPRYGEDITENHLPQETQLLHAVHFNKGCYLGQEIVERIRSRGHVNWLLVRLEIDSDAAPPLTSKALVEGKEAGALTSAAWSPALGRVVALAYLRTEHVRGGKSLHVNGARAEISAPAPTSSPTVASPKAGGSS